MGSFIANVNKIAAGIPDGQTLTDVVTEINTLIEQKDAAMDARVDAIEAMPLYSDAERLKLAGIEQGATANDTNIELRDRSTHTGTQSVSTLTETDTLKIMTDIERTKLDGIEQGATANDTDVELRDRSTHTGTQPVSTITETDTLKIMTNAERTKLAGIDDNANAYVHPLKHSASIIDGTGFEGKVVKVDGSGSTGFDNVTWGEIVGKPSSFIPDDHNHDITDIVTGHLSATRINETSELQFVTNDEKLIIAGAELAINKGANGGYAPLDLNGKIPTSYMPSVSVIDVFTVTSEAEMLALDATQGDIALRQDTNTQFMLQAVPATSIDNWVELVSQVGVTSLNGQIGIVNITTADVPEVGNLYYTAARVQAEIADAHDTVGTFTNKTIDSHSNRIGANHVHYKVKATENMAVGDVVKIVGYQNGEDAIRVAKTTSLNDVAIGVVEHSMVAGEFGLVVNTGTVDGIDTTAWTFGTILYSDGAGGFTNVKPTSDMYQACGYVMRVNSNNGSLLVEFTEPRVNYVDADLSGLVL